MMNRTISPQTTSIQGVDQPTIKKIFFPNGVPCYQLGMDRQDVCRLDLIFGSGGYDQERPLQASMTNQMLREGSRGYTSFQIVELLDFHGATLQNSTSYHNSYLTLYTLTSHWDAMIDLLSSMVLYPEFPESMFQSLILRHKQAFLNNSQKVQTMAARGYDQMMFGLTHPYGCNPVAEDYDTLTVEHLKRFFEQNYGSDNCRLFLTGNLTDEQMKKLEDAFGKVSFGGRKGIVRKGESIQPSKDQRLFIHKAGAMQSAIEMACSVPDRSHPDYMGLRVLNVVLGGYFGSRLMGKIREEKGYTYGIGSRILTLPLASTMRISTQTATQWSELLIGEVHSEIKRLQQETMPKEELMQVKNYMLGEIARTYDTPFSTADNYIGLLVNDLPFNYHQLQIQAIQSSTVEQMQRLANEYLDWKKFKIVVAGEQL